MVLNEFQSFFFLSVTGLTRLKEIMVIKAKLGWGQSLGLTFLNCKRRFSYRSVKGTSCRVGQIT